VFTSSDNIVSTSSENITKDDQQTTSVQTPKRRLLVRLAMLTKKPERQYVTGTCIPPLPTCYRRKQPIIIMRIEKQPTGDVSSASSTEEPLDLRVTTIAKEFNELSVADLSTLRSHSPAKLEMDQGVYNNKENSVERDNYHDATLCNADGDIRGSQWCRYNPCYRTSTNDDSVTNNRRAGYVHQDGEEGDDESTNVTLSKRRCQNNRHHANETADIPMVDAQIDNGSNENGKEVESLSDGVRALQLRMMTLARRNKDGSRSQSESEYDS